MSRAAKKGDLPEDDRRQRRKQASKSPALAERAGSTSPSTRPITARDIYVATAVCCFLLLAVAVVFGQAVNFDFVNYDDNDYVYQNPRITQDSAAKGAAWALTGVHAGNWHPLTWLSHIVDYRVYGLHAGGHHLTNVILHAVTAIALFLVLWRMTGNLWPAAFVAAVFALHPLRAESVAWVAERKDVLSGLFFMLTLAAYVGYVRRPFSFFRYAAVVVLFALGLMSKPMLVTLPFVLLLLDYWPLGRMAIPSSKGKGRGVPVFRSLLIEKVPLLLLAAGSCVATALVQSKCAAGLQSIPLHTRLANAAVSYVAYLGQFLLPANLAVFYPYARAGQPLWTVLLAIIVLTAISLVVLMRRRTNPFLLVGWCWYLGMLVPVIGLMQVGQQSMADRYTYLPQIGLCIALAWGAVYATASWPLRRWLLGSVSALIVVALAVTAWRQTGFWRDSKVLWTHALECTSDNYVAHANLGQVYTSDGRTDDAIKHLRAALDIDPNTVEASGNLGILFARKGQSNEAIALFDDVLKIDPDNAVAHHNLGIELMKKRRIDDAIAHYEMALRRDPDNAVIHAGLATALVRRGRSDDAISHFEKALALKPDYAAAHCNLGIELAGKGLIDDAIAHYREALRIREDHVQDGGAVAPAAQTRTGAANPETLQANQDRFDAHSNLGVALASCGRFDEAIVHYHKALDLKPDVPLVLNNLAWLRATCSKPSCRDSAEAVALAERASRLSGGKLPTFFDTLAAAYAEAGRFAEAIKAANKAIDLARQQNHQDLAERITTRLKLYEAKTPYREELPASAAPKP
jgi:protein O-mannosyl-transferase